MRRIVLSLALVLMVAHLAAAQTIPQLRQKVVSTPAASSLATASIAAVAGKQHVADCVLFSAGSTTAPALTQLTINLRDGASGAGTVLSSWTVVIPATTGQNVAPFGVCGLYTPGTTNTAMTLEFSSLLTKLFENVTLVYFDVTPPPFNP